MKKKIISLVLTIAMLFSMTTFVKAFDDVDVSNVNYDAINIMSSLGILNGVDGKNFEPNATLTRAQAAKIISYMLMGTESAEQIAATVGGSSFTDVSADHWAAPYIEFCAKMGVVAGYGDGTFGPEDLLNGYQFAKMLLVAAGIDGDYTGTTWEINVSMALDSSKKNDVNKNGLLLNLENIKMEESLSRASAAQFALNTLLFKNKESKYKIIILDEALNSLTSTIKNETFDSYVDAAVFMNMLGAKATQYEIDRVYSTLGEDNFDLKTMKGYVYRNSAISEDEFTTILGEDKTYHSFNISTDIDLIGHYVEVFYVDEWEYEKGSSNEEKKGVTYTITDLTTVIEVKEDIEKVSLSSVKSTFGIKTVPTTIYDISNYSELEEAKFLTQNANDATKYDIAAGSYLMYENNDEEMVLYARLVSENYLDTFVVEYTDDNYYTVSGKYDDYLYVNAEEDEDECFNKIATNINWKEYIGCGDDFKNDEDRGEVTFEVTQCGDQFFLSPLRTVVGSITRVISDTRNENYSIYIDGKKYDFDYFGRVPETLDANDTYGAGMTDFDVTNTTDRIFYFCGDKIVGWKYVDAADAKIVVAVMLYTIEDESTNAYGKSSNDKYSYYLQGIDANGKEINLPVKFGDANSMGMFLTGGDGEGWTVTGKPVEDSANLVAAGMDELYCYTIEYDSKDGKDYAYFSNPVDELDKDVEFTGLTDGGIVSSDTRYVYINGSKCYITSPYTVYLYSGEGETLRITAMNKAYRQLQDADVICYAEKEAKGNYYHLTSAFKRSDTIVGDELIFVNVETATQEVERISYTNNKGNKVTTNAYTISAYIDGKETTIKSVAAIRDTGLYEYTIDEYSGLYTLINYNGNDTYIVKDIEDNNGFVTFGDVIEDADLTNVKIVNTTEYTGKIKLGDDKYHDYICLLKLDADDEIEIIYVIKVLTKEISYSHNGLVLDNNDIINIVGNDCVIYYGGKQNVQGIIVEGCESYLIDTSKRTISCYNVSSELVIVTTEENCTSRELNIKVEKAS